MELLEKAKETAIHLTELAKEKVDELKDKRRAGDLLDDLGRAVFRQRTGRGEAGDDAAIASIVAELEALEAGGTAVLGVKEPATTTTNGSDIASTPSTAASTASTPTTTGASTPTTGASTPLPAPTDSAVSSGDIIDPPATD
jgi:hypothetical protein